MKPRVKPLVWVRDPGYSRWLGKAGPHEVMVIHYGGGFVLASYTLLPIGWRYRRRPYTTVADAKKWADRKWAAWVTSLLESK